MYLPHVCGKIKILILKNICPNRYSIYYVKYVCSRKETCLDAYLIFNAKVPKMIGQIFVSDFKVNRFVLYLLKCKIDRTPTHALTCAKMQICIIRSASLCVCETHKQDGDELESWIVQQSLQIFWTAYVAENQSYLLFLCY